MRSNSLKKLLFRYPIHRLTEVFGRISQFSRALCLECLRYWEENEW